jgi:hypothetical protein
VLRECVAARQIAPRAQAVAVRCGALLALHTVLAAAGSGPLRARLRTQCALRHCHSIANEPSSARGRSAAVAARDPSSALPAKMSSGFAVLRVDGTVLADVRVSARHPAVYIPFAVGRTLGWRVPDRAKWLWDPILCTPCVLRRAAVVVDCAHATAAGGDAKKPADAAAAVDVLWDMNSFNGGACMVPVRLLPAWAEAVCLPDGRCYLQPRGRMVSFTEQMRADSLGTQAPRTRSGPGDETTMGSVAVADETSYGAASLTESTADCGPLLRIGRGKAPFVRAQLRRAEGSWLAVEYAHISACAALLFVWKCSLSFLCCELTCLSVSFWTQPPRIRFSHSLWHGRLACYRRRRTRRLCYRQR